MAVLVACAVAMPAFGMPHAYAGEGIGDYGVEVGASGEGFKTGVFIPGGSDGGDETRRRAAQCVGCTWRMVPSCDVNGWQGYDPITGEERWENGTLCPRYSSCSGSRNRWDIYLRESGATNFRRVGDVCLAAGQRPLHGEELVRAPEFAEFLTRLAPPRLNVQPPTNQLVGVPTVFYVDEPTVGTPQYTAFGITVTIFPRVSYMWDFGEGPEVGPTDEGRPRPHHTIDHTYAAPGSKTVSVHATWTATVEALGVRFELGESVTRTASRTIVVREARTQLQDG